MSNFNRFLRDLGYWYKVQEYIKTQGRRPPEKGALSIQEDGGELTEVEG